MRHPQTGLSLADGGAHCGVICDASIPTFMLMHWARDRDARRAAAARVRGAAADARHRARSTGCATAASWRPGMKADVNVIDFANLSLPQPEVRFDLPAGGRRLFQAARGYRATLVAGRWCTRTASRPGRCRGA